MSETANSILVPQSNSRIRSLTSGRLTETTRRTPEITETDSWMRSLTRSSTSWGLAPG